MNEAPTLKLHPKQQEAFRHLTTKGIHTVLFGGGLSTGKTRGACIWVLWSALTYPNTRYLIGRKRLTDLRSSTLVTLQEVARQMGIYDVFLAGWNQTQNRIDLPNGSSILLRQLDVKDNDEEMVELGSLEITGAVIDELGEVSQIAYRTLLQRLRWNLPPHGGKILLVSNPTKNWAYRDIYIPWEQGTLPAHTRYVHTIPSDNPFNPPGYLATLTPELLGASLYESRVLGSWHASNDDHDLVSESSLLDAFTFDTIGVDQREPYLTWDPAYGGKDRSVVCVWRGLVLIECLQWRKVDPEQQVADVRRIISEHHIPARNVSIDGIGSAALVSQFRGCVDHRANAKPIGGESFNSLKDQLYHRLAQGVKCNEFRFKVPEIRDQLIEEVMAHKAYRTEHDQPARVTPKDVVTRFLGRSPDISDAVAQRCYWLLQRRPMSVRFHQW